MIHVTTTAGDVHDYPKGKSWHIDETRQLHVRADEGNIGSYAVGCWAAVREAEPGDQEKDPA